MQEVKKVKVRFFVDDKLWQSRCVYPVPKVGDRVKFSGNKYFTVKMLVWLMDEYEFSHQKCNIYLIRVA